MSIMPNIYLEDRAEDIRLNQAVSLPVLPNVKHISSQISLNNDHISEPKLTSRNMRSLLQNQSSHSRSLNNIKNTLTSRVPPETNKIAPQLKVSSLLTI